MNKRGTFGERNREREKKNNKLIEIDTDLVKEFITNLFKVKKLYAMEKNFRLKERVGI